ncbi:leucine-rich repeat and transmembrane domain-containing protein 2-like [Uloborus diversus]|uniref:leucine-rich repeat and transmembrane domain-containing protein 2-like n=1 Tax=Uloborus diversus TaxID=327109 RepID=UPI0024098F8B|nr:leucine-rich repeat and transmembrane domain-containing protein 2-like [Uloborus diversus]
MNMSELPFSFFQGLQFKMLEISYSTLRNFTDTGETELEGLRQHLETIAITHTIEDDFRLNVSSFKNLEILDISYNDFKTVKKEWFEDTPSSLKSLTLYKNNIQKLEEGAFFEMSQLERLELTTNRISEIKRNMFPGPGNKLRSLHLAYNAIKTIPRDFFTDMDSLKNLQLRYNRIEVLPRRTWESIWMTLNFLHLNGNPLKCDDGIEWMFYVPRPDHLTGKCFLPKQCRGKDLNKLIDEKARENKKTQM